jgi:hypothetical protein
VFLDRLLKWSKKDGFRTKSSTYKHNGIVFYLVSGWNQVFDENGVFLTEEMSWK